MLTVHPRRRASAAAAVLMAIALVAVVACSGSGRTPRGAAGQRPNTPPSRIHWSGCGKSMECGTLQVPLDWTKPGGRRISLYLSRKPATDPEHRAGSVVFNFGGPGVSGASDFGDYVASFDDSAKDLNERYDLVSWDPRGTGRSDGIRCTTRAEALEPDPDPTPDTPQETAALARKLTSETTDCLAKAGDLLPYVDTWSTVRDLDAIRAALGDDQLTYVGFSYGTELGMAFLATFPTRARAMVLDGIALPQGPIQTSRDQAVGFEHAIRTYLADCRSKGSRCQFGNGDPLAAFTSLRDRLDAGARIPASGRCAVLGGALEQRKGSLGIGELDTAVGQAMYDRQLWPILTIGLEDATRSVNPDASCLLALRDYYEGLRPDGQLDHLLDSFEAIGCADQSERATNPIGDHPELVQQWSKELPLVGGQFASGLPGCWRFPPARHPAEPFQPSQFRRAPPVVIVGNTGDPATPFAHAQRAASLLPGSRLVTWESTEHTVFLSHGSSCIDRPLVTYLITRQLPEKGLRCKP